MTLAETWFAIIALLWIGYFFLEGFDFGVGISLPILGKTDTDRRLLINSIGPIWDANEVWVIVAGGATFAAFPAWYATMLSAFYIPVFLILIGLIVRALAFEYRAKRDDAKWKRNWDNCIFLGSLIPAFLWGVAFANIVRGVPLNDDFNFAGSLIGLLNPYALLGGITTVLIFTVHGNVFLSLKNTGVLRERANKLAGRLALPAFVVLTAFLCCTYWNARSTGHTGLVPAYIPITAMATMFGASWLIREKQEGWSFVATGTAIVLLFTTLFLNLYPNVMPDLHGINHMTIADTASNPYTLKVMSVIALFAVPFVVAYQSWTYWVFRKRLDRPVGETENSH